MQSDHKQVIEIQILFFWNINILFLGQLTKVNKNLPLFDENTLSYIPSNDCLPPTVNFSKPENTYTECSNNESVVEMLRNEILVFAIQRNLNVYVKIVNCKYIIIRF